MKISWIKQEKDDKNFRMAEKLGMRVYSIADPEQIDSMIENLRQNHMDTIVISNELAGFSEDIIKKYQKDEQIKIIISPRF